MALDFKSILGFMLTVFSIISLKLVDMWFCYSISILIKDVKFF